MELGAPVAKVDSTDDLTERLGPLHFPQRSTGVRQDSCVHGVAIRVVVGILSMTAFYLAGYYLGHSAHWHVLALSTRVRLSYYKALRSCHPRTFLVMVWPKCSRSIPDRREVERWASTFLVTYSLFRKKILVQCGGRYRIPPTP